MGYELYKDGKKVKNLDLIEVDSVYSGHGGRAIVQKPKNVSEADMKGAMQIMSGYMRGEGNILVLPHNWKLLAVLDQEPKQLDMKGRYEMFLTEGELVDFLKMDPDNEMVKNIERISVGNGLIHIIGEQHKIVDGKVIPEG